MLKPIPTIYEGQRFRSRLEARWAIYMDALSVDYQYEAEALDLGDGLTYVPDFFLPSFPAWLEIKGEIRSDDAGLLIMRKAAALARLSGHPVILAFNDPLDQRCAVFGRKGQMYAGSHFTICPRCGQLCIHVRDGVNTLFLCPGRAAHGDTLLSVEEVRRRSRAAFDVATAAKKQPFGISRKDI